MKSFWVVFLKEMTDSLRDRRSITAAMVYSLFGPLAIGNLKYKTQFALYRAIQTAPEPALLDLPEAFRCAGRELVNADAVAAAA